MGDYLLRMPYLSGHLARDLSATPRITPDLRQGYCGSGSTALYSGKSWPKRHNTQIQPGFERSLLHMPCCGKHATTRALIKPSQDQAKTKRLERRSNYNPPLSDHRDCLWISLHKFKFGLCRPVAAIFLLITRRPPQDELAAMYKG